MVSVMALFANIACFMFITACSGDTKAPTEFQKALKGVYVPLFSNEGANAKKWDQLWLSETAKLMGEANPEATVKRLKGSVAGTVIGKEAVKTYGDYANSSKDFSMPFKFDCSFKQGVTRLKFDGRNIQGIDSAGRGVFSHTYSCIGYDKEMGIYKYKSDDGNNDEFTYFVFLPDTPANTHHIELRYGNDMGELLALRTGRYAYWMAAGVLENNDDDCIGSIRLFVKENTDKGK